MAGKDLRHDGKVLTGEPAGSSVPRVTIWRRVGYAFCNAGSALGGTPISLLLLYYLTEIVGIRPSVAGLVLALPKVWDAFVDPMFGGWVDQVSMRIGRRAPIALISGAIYLVALVLIFSLPRMNSPSEMVIVAVLLLIASSVSQTALGVSQWALATDMTTDSIELNGLLSLATITAQIFNLGAAIAIPMLIVWSGGGAAGYSRMAAEVAAVAGVAILIFVISTYRFPTRMKSEEISERSLWSSFLGTLANRAFYYVMAFVICQNIIIAFFLGFLPFANEYVLAGNSQDLSIMEGVIGGAAVAGMALAPLYVRRFSELASMQISNVIAGLALALLFVTGDGPTWMRWLTLGGIGLGWGTIGVLVQSVTLNAARAKPKVGVLVAIGFYLGTMMAGIKLGGSAGGFISGEYLELIGFVSGGKHQTAATVTWIHIGYTFLPLLFAVASGLLLARVKLPSNIDEKDESADAQPADCTYGARSE